MPPEIAGQRITGSPLSERDCYARAIYHIQGLRECLRGLALLRNDLRWLVPVRFAEQLEYNVRRMMTARQSKILVLPERDPRLNRF